MITDLKSKSTEKLGLFSFSQTTDLQLNFITAAMAGEGFIKCPADALKWSYRSPMILEEITRTEADIICLEEVDHFSDFLEPQLSRLGFKGLFVPKNDSPCLQFQPNNGPDGCALFFRSSKFALLEKRDFRLKNASDGISNQVALFVRLEVKITDTAEIPQSQICVGVTHFKAKKDYSVLRLAQGEHLLEEMASFAKNQPVIICGDFNAPPDEPVYRHFSNNKAHQWLMVSSTHAGSYYNEKEPQFTSWKFRANGEVKYTIDYIWVSTDKIVVDSVWQLPTEKEIGEGGLPCTSYPSDHLAICSYIRLL